MWLELFVQEAQVLGEAPETVEFQSEQEEGEEPSDVEAQLLKQPSERESIHADGDHHEEDERAELACELPRVVGVLRGHGLCEARDGSAACLTGDHDRLDRLMPRRRSLHALGQRSRSCQDERRFLRGHGDGGRRCRRRQTDDRPLV